jgi:preprotein translocase subunit SecD
MYKNLRWKFLVTALVAVIAIWSFTPPSKKIKLGLDLQGGVHLVYKVQTDAAIKVETETSSEQLADALKTAGIAVESVKVTGLTEFEVNGVPPASDQQFRTAAETTVGGSFAREAGNAPNSYVFRMKPNILVNHRAEAVTQALQTIERRVNEYGVTEPIVAPYGSTGDQIVIELPGVTNVDEAKSLIRNTAQLEIKLVEGEAGDEATLLASHGGKVPDDMMIVPGSSGVKGDTTKVLYLVRKVAAITGRDLRNAKPTIDETNLPAVAFTLNSDGVTKFSKVTGENVGRQLAIILDGAVQSAPRIESKISQPEARITGGFTQQEAQTLSLILRSGALPAPLEPQGQDQVGPTLGADSVRAGILASLVGLGLVTLFMLVYYKLAGINAFVSVTLNLIILLGFMAYLGAVMTLPGIAGFVLTIGMGVDSNVLIFERIREELDQKKGARQAIAAGFDRVFVTIVDTHVSSLIAAAFLFQFGTGPIRGFATTLFFGLVSNVFTAVFVSRSLFELILSKRQGSAATQQLSI